MNISQTTKLGSDDEEKKETFIIKYGCETN